MSDMKKYLKAVTQLNESFDPSVTEAYTSKEYGIRYKVFAGREGRLTTKEKWFATSAQLEKFAEKVQNMGNFYEIDGYAYPRSNDALGADQVEEGRHDEFDWVQQLVRDKEASMAPANTGTPKRFKMIQNGNIIDSFDTVDQATAAWQQLPPSEQGRTKIRENVDGVDVDVIVEMDAGGTCSASIATAPAGDLFGKPQKRVAEDDDGGDSDFVGDPYRRDETIDEDDEELSESIKAAFEDYVKGKDTDEKCKVKITYKDGHSQTKMVTDKEKQRYETSASVDKVEVVKDGAARLDDAITESVKVAFIGKFSKNGKNYSLWQKGDYWYELTRSSQGSDGSYTHVHEWHDTSVEEIQDELQNLGFSSMANEGVIDDIKRTAKSVGRGMKGWGGVEDSPRELVKRNKSHDDETLTRIDKAIKTPLGFPFRNGDYDGKDKHTPAGLQKRVVDREMKKRGLSNESADANPYHRVLVTLSDPNATMASRRGEKIQKHIRITGDLADAVNKAKAFYKKKGYRVHDAEVVDSYAISQESKVTEISQKAKNDYIDSATGDYADANAQRQHDPENAGKHEERMAKRQKGLAMATGTDKDLRKIDELDNGPKGRVKTDKINYDARRGGDISPVKDQLEKNKGEEERRRADRKAATAAYKSANSKASRLADKQTEKIELNQNVSFDTLAKLAREYAGVNDIADVINHRTYYTKINGEVVAGIQLDIYASYDPSDFGYDQETIDQMGGENLSDLIKLRFARDPENPRKIIFTGYGA